MTTVLSPFLSMGQFGEKQIINESLGAVAKILPIDYDMDGDNDLIVTDGTKLVFYENMGNDSLASQLVISQTAGRIINIADIDNDGKIDLLANINGKIGWYKNYGDNSFTDFHLICSGNGGAYSIDIDNDNDSDIFVIIPDNNKISWYQNDGTGNFGVENIVSSSIADIFELYVADMNNDGWFDLIVECNNTSGDMSIDYLQNNGNNTFSNTNLINSVFWPGYIQIIDFDNDGLKDIVYENLKWLRNLGNGNFAAPSDIDTPIFATFDAFNLYDFNNDGNADIVYGENTVFDDHTRISYFDGTNFHPYQSFNYYTSSFDYSATTIMFSDFNADGYVDIIEGLSTGEILWLKNDSTNHFYSQRLLNNKSYTPDKYFILDYDQDSIKDLVVYYRENNFISFFKNTGNGQFTAGQNILDTLENADIDIKDIDNDGDFDIIYRTCSYPKKLFVLKNNLTYWDSTEIDSIGNFKLADFNNDNYLDLLFGKDSSMYISLNDGNGNFSMQSLTPIITLSSGNFLDEIQIADMDNDNDNDIVAILYNSSQIVELINDGSNNFTMDTIDYAGGSPSYLQLVDFNNDGKLDIVSRHGQYDIMLNQNNGNNLFSQENLLTISVNQSIKYIKTCDINNDGYTDLICNIDNQVYWYKNINNTIEQQGNLISNSDLTKFSFFDIDNDGSKDMFYIYQLANQVGWMKNYVNYPFKITGNLFYDSIPNGIRDSSESGFLHSNIQISPSFFASYTDQDGNYWAAVTTGTYNVTYNPIPYWHLSSADSSYQVTITTNNPVKDSCNFGFYPDTIITDMQADLTFDYGICNNFALFWINYRNLGTTHPHGIIQFQLDTAVSLYSSQIPSDSISNNNIYWHFDSLNYFEEKTFWVLLYWVPPYFIGDSLHFTLNINSLDSLNNINAVFNDSSCIEITCAYDPNKKTVDPLGTDSTHYISNNQELKYTIHFQNTGNDTAVNVVILDTLSNNLNDTTFRFVSSSFPCRIFRDGNVLHFEFDSIMLPDSNISEVNSHGFVKYAIKPLTGLYPNTEILNSANIYFDYNPPITTNTTLNTIECWLTPSPTISYTGGYLTVSGYLGLPVQWYLNDTIIPNATDTFISPQWSGQYSVEVTNIYGCSATSDYFGYIVNIPNQANTSINIFPNPSSGIIFIESPQAIITGVEITDITGRTVVSKNSHDNYLQIDFGNKSGGIYFVTVRTKRKSFVKKLTLIR